MKGSVKPVESHHKKNDELTGNKKSPATKMRSKQATMSHTAATE